MSAKLVLRLLIGTLLVVHFCYQPRWTRDMAHATISWDVSGYYAYLPAIFIYDDVQQAAFLDTIIERYHNVPAVAMQAFRDEASGNRVMKYSIGQSITYLPWFLAAHAYASATPKYPPDGYSRPYQFAVSMGTLVYMIIGLLFLFRVLRIYFDDLSVSLALVAIVLGSNYLNYTAIEGAMTHNSVFTLYAILIYVSITYHRRPSLGKGLAIGALVGFAALIRPTELISLLIPITWGVDFTRPASIRQRLGELGANWQHLAAAAVVTAAIGSIQLAYWHHVTGSWFVYSYQEEGFSWLAPHIYQGLVSYRSGWLTYSPLMVFSLVGFYFLYRQQRNVFFGVLSFAVVFMYIAWAWDIWWYGGSLGQRTMVQAYPILAFPLCAMAAAARRFARPLRYGLAAVALFCVYVNLWFTHQAHHGGMLHVGEQNGAYYWATFLTWERDDRKTILLDGVPRLFPGTPSRTEPVYHDSEYSVRLDGENQYSGTTVVDADLLPEDYDWFRVTVRAYPHSKEWNFWRQAHFTVKTRDAAGEVTSNFYRMYRVLDIGTPKELYLDVRKPKRPITHIDVYFWNADGQLPIDLSNLRIDALYE